MGEQEPFEYRCSCGGPDSVDCCLPCWADAAKVDARRHSVSVPCCLQGIATSDTERALICNGTPCKLRRIMQWPSASRGNDARRNNRRAGQPNAKRDATGHLPNRRGRGDETSTD